MLGETPIVIDPLLRGAIAFGLLAIGLSLGFHELWQSRKDNRKQEAESDVDAATLAVTVLEEPTSALPESSDKMRP